MDPGSPRGSVDKRLDDAGSETNECARTQGA
ncbi:MAG: hypothetical protein QOH68_4022, partial [Nocardioidaceae bacterium]|nr:hypothetical protein [Nocardioidaceae bacterium]